MSFATPTRETAAHFGAPRAAQHVAQHAASSNAQGAALLNMLRSVADGGAAAASSRPAVGGPAHARAESAASRQELYLRNVLLSAGGGAPLGRGTEAGAATTTAEPAGTSPAPAEAAAGGQASNPTVSVAGDGNLVSSGAGAGADGNLAGCVPAAAGRRKKRNSCKSEIPCVTIPAAPQMAASQAAATAAAASGSRSGKEKRSSSVTNTPVASRSATPNGRSVTPAGSRASTPSSANRRGDRRERSDGGGSGGSSGGSAVKRPQQVVVPPPTAFAWSAFQNSPDPKSLPMPEFVDDSFHQLPQPVLGV
ncbi:unnamed protein product, partial [Phaeothamnion confervicola]